MCWPMKKNQKNEYKKLEDMSELIENLQIKQQDNNRRNEELQNELEQAQGQNQETIVQEKKAEQIELFKTNNEIKKNISTIKIAKQLKEQQQQIENIINSIANIKINENLAGKIQIAQKNLNDLMVNCMLFQDFQEAINYYIQKVQGVNQQILDKQIQADLDQLEKEKNAIKEIIKNNEIKYQKEIDSKSDEIELLSKSNQEYKKLIEQLQKTEKTLLEQKESLTQENKQLQTQFNEQISNLHYKLRAKKDLYSTNLNTLTKENEQMNTQFKKEIDILNQKRNKYKKLYLDISRSQDQKYQEQQTKIKALYQTIQQNCYQYQIQITDKDQRIREYETQIKNLEQNFNYLKQQNDEINAKFINNQNTLKEKEAIIDQFKSNQQIQEITTVGQKLKIQQLKNQIEEKDKKLFKKREELKIMTQQINSMNTRSIENEKILKDKNFTLEQQRELISQQQNSIIIQTNSQLQIQLDEKNIEINNLKQELDDSSKQIKNLVNELTILNEHNQQLLTQISNYQIQLKVKDINISQNTTQISDLKTSCGSFNTFNKQLQESPSTLKHSFIENQSDNATIMKQSILSQENQSQFILNKSQLSISQIYNINLQMNIPSQQNNQLQNIQNSPSLLQIIEE